MAVLNRGLNAEQTCDEGRGFDWRGELRYIRWFDPMNLLEQGIRLSLIHIWDVGAPAISVGLV